MADSYTPVSMIRGNSTIIDSTPIVDGQILFDETRKCLFMDNGSTREKYSGLGADSNIANVEDTTTASQPYTTGEFVVVEGQLYKVTASIATGDTFSVGTNIDTDTVGSEITQLNASLSNIVPQASKNTRLMAVGINVLDGTLDNNRLYFVSVPISTNCPPQATTGLGLRIMYYTGGNYWTNIVYFYHLDGGQMYFNAYHKATGAWQGWKKGFKSGAIYLGQYSADTTIDVSDLGATSVDQFVAVAQTLTFSNDPARVINGYFVVGVGFTAPTMTLSNGKLTVTRAWARSAVNNDNPGTTRNVPYRVYFVGDIETR